ncbi:MAG: prepilin-type N-terminal cleavage/methylation domain-containing protein [Candidatus Sumerlaeaceae bacterium]|nr:prepilin-type N-terminal cleavage/methylation domain-containing protein [Candidatus Sumerlaeaceae bacterium]
MRRYTNHKVRGVTLTELLVVMVIVTLFSTIAVIAYINRMEEARISIARGECRELAEAEEQCALIHGYYVPLQVLDDKPDLNNITSTGDAIDLDLLNSLFVINPLVPPVTQQGNQLNMNNTNQRIQDLVDNWQGPFLTTQRVYTGNADPTNPNFINSTEIHLDFPLDPWGTPYRFYSPLGIIGSNATTQDYTNLGVAFSNGILTNNIQEPFDRYAVTSWGRNTQPNTLTPSDTDDIIYQFGMAGVESTFANP